MGVGISAPAAVESPKLTRPLEFQVVGLCSRQNAVDIARRARMSIAAKVWKQSTDFWKRSEDADRRQTPLQGMLDYLRAPSKKQWR